MCFEIIWNLSEFSSVFAKKNNSSVSPANLCSLLSVGSPKPCSWKEVVLLADLTSQAASHRLLWRCLSFRKAAPILFYHGDRGAADRIDCDSGSDWLVIWPPRRGKETKKTGREKTVGVSGEERWGKDGEERRTTREKSEHRGKHSRGQNQLLASLSDPKPGFGQSWLRDRGVMGAMGRPCTFYKSCL